jgi:hypothetical protein
MENNNMIKKYFLRNTSTGAINLPTETWKELGWKINEEVELIKCEEYDDKGNFSHYSITIERSVDL